MVEILSLLSSCTENEISFFFAVYRVRAATEGRLCWTLRASMALAIGMFILGCIKDYIILD
jgi:hypothetical protein